MKLRNPLKGLRGKKKRWLLLLVVIALAGGAVTVRLLSKPQTASAVTSYQEEEISQRDIVNSLSSSGTLQPADSYTVSTLVSGEILSDTFEEFAMPLMKKLGYPTLLCNSLEVASDGTITDFKMRVEHSKLTTVRALQSIGYKTIASGDSYNDLDMIRASHAGFLFRSPESIRSSVPEIPAYETFDELLSAVREAVKQKD